MAGLPAGRPFDVSPTISSRTRREARRALPALDLRRSRRTSRTANATIAVITISHTASHAMLGISKTPRFQKNFSQPSHSPAAVVGISGDGHIP